MITGLVCKQNNFFLMVIVRIYFEDPSIVNYFYLLLSKVNSERTFKKNNH